STVAYSWVGPNSFSSGQQNPSITGSTAAHTGEYIVTADNYGCTAKDTVNVVIGVANASIGSNSPLCAGATLNLVAGSSTPGVTYSWTGPNSFSSTQQNPAIGTVTAAATGTYTVTITSPQCNTVLSTYVTINAIPVTPTAGSNSPVCAGQNINLTASSSTPGVTYSWTG